MMSSQLYPRIMEQIASVSPARLLIVDDNPFVRVGLQMTLRDASDLVVVGEAANGAQAVDLCRELEPDLVVTDLRMPVMDGLQATAAIKSAYPQVCVIVMSVEDDLLTRTQAELAGADAFLPKDAPPEEFLRQIRLLVRTR
jgi:DNA-binding NarL/FixJ family response regulator